MDMHDLGVFGSSDSDSSLDGDRRRSRAAAAEKDEKGYYSRATSRATHTALEALPRTRRTPRPTRAARRPAKT